MHFFLILVYRPKTARLFFLWKGPRLGPLGPDPIQVIAGAPGAPGAQPPLRGALSFFPWKAPQCGVLEGFWTLSRQLSPGTRAPVGPWAFRAPHTQGPQGPQRGPGPLVSGALTWGPWGPTPHADSRKKKSRFLIHLYAFFNKELVQI